MNGQESLSNLVPLLGTNLSTTVTTTTTSIDTNDEPSYTYTRTYSGWLILYETTGKLKSSLKSLRNINIISTR